MVGIINYGTYIPRNRLKTVDVARAWGKIGGDVESSLGIIEESVASIDEDAVTMAVESASQALLGFNREELEAIFVGSESHPYAVNPTATIVGELLGIGHNYLGGDLEFACKAGTAGMQAIAGLSASGQIKAGLAIGTDAAQSRPHDALEYASASAAVAVLMGNDTEYPVIAKLLGYTSYSSDTPDFWRRDGIRYPSHAGRFTGEPAYFAHVTGAALRLFEKTQYKSSDITHCVFHMPNGKFPRQVAKRLGFEEGQLVHSLTVDHIGNPYSASSMLGLAATLDVSKPGDTIFMVSYGSGAGSDAFLWEVTEKIEKRDKEPFGYAWFDKAHHKQGKQEKRTTVKEQIERKKYIDYVQYLKMTHKI